MAGTVEAGFYFKIEDGETAKDRIDDIIDAIDPDKVGFSDYDTDTERYIKVHEEKLTVYEHPRWDEIHVTTIVPADAKEAINTIKVVEDCASALGKSASVVSSR